jgi:S-layer homology domain
MEKIKGACAVAVLTLLVSGNSLFNAAPAHAATCLADTPPPSNDFPGAVVAETSFESNNLLPFRANTAGTGTATVEDTQAKSGACSAFLHVTADAGSLANLSLPLGGGTTTAYADGWFNITTAGLAGNNVPYFRFFSGDTRIADVFRNNSNGQLWLRTATTPSGPFVYTRLRPAAVPLNAWHRISVRVSPDNEASVIQVWFDGVLIHSSNQNSTNATTLSRLQIGAEHRRQMGDSYIDNVVVKSSTVARVFSDVAPSDQFAAEIAWLAGSGITTGFPDGTFRPMGPVNRAAMAAFLYRFSGSPAYNPPATATFTDVPTNHQFYKEISWLMEQGITTGMTPTTFAPQVPVNRKDMAAFLYRFRGSPEVAVPAASPFADVPTNHQFFKEIMWLKDTGITTGFTETSYAPMMDVIRKDMAAFLFRYDAEFNAG